MDKLFLKLGVHRFWAFTALKFAYISVFVVMCFFHIRHLSFKDLDAQQFMSQSILWGYAYICAFFVIAIVFGRLLCKVVDPNTFLHFDASLLDALKKEAERRSAPITWSMVARIVVQVHDLNKDIEKKSRQARDMKAQMEWLSSHNK